LNEEINKEEQEKEQELHRQKMLFSIVEVNLNYGGKGFI